MGDFYPLAYPYMPYIHAVIFLIEYILISALGPLAPFQETEKMPIPSGLAHA
jgi:hypothetical protein